MRSGSSPALAATHRVSYTKNLALGKFNFLISSQFKFLIILQNYPAISVMLCLIQKTSCEKFICLCYYALLFLTLEIMALKSKI